MCPQWNHPEVPLPQLVATGPGCTEFAVMPVPASRRASSFAWSTFMSLVSQYTISPTKLFLGVVNPGQKVTKNLVVRGKKPFKITEIEAPQSFQIEPSADAKVVHLIPVIFTAGDEAGRVSQKISIHTDQGDVVQAFTAFAEVVKSDEPASAAPKSSENPPLEAPALTQP